MEYPDDVVTASVALDERALATILAALRYWQASPARGEGTDLDDIATNFESFEALTEDEIDDLCHSLNNTGI